MKNIFFLFILLNIPLSAVSAPPKSELDGFGSSDTTSAEYRLSPGVDADILNATSATTGEPLQVEIWAKLYRPKDMGTQKHPILVFLHGNHATCGSGSNPITDESCEYTEGGICPDGKSVIPNHLGYEYLATRLASFGYVVISINANRGITCGDGVDGDGGLNLARGRLVLRHLALLSQWNKSGGTPRSLGVDLRGKLDFNQVGMMGHSRGGEGVRAAYNIYQDSDGFWKSLIGDMTVRGIFEIGPVDGQTSRILNATGAAWNVLLPMCDGDVSTLWGMKPYDRMLDNMSEATALPKSMFAVWGANHNYYNTEWQTSDSPGCVGSNQLWTGDVGSEEERQTAIQSMIPFFRAYVGMGRYPEQANTFDPLTPLPDTLASITRVDRTFTLSPSERYVIRAETFKGSPGIGSLGQPHESRNITVKHQTVPEHDPVLRSERIIWNNGGTDRYFQDNWTAPGDGFDFSHVATVDFRVSRADSTLNPQEGTDFDIQLIYSNGSLGQAVPLSKYFSLVGPIGIQGDLHRTLPTVRIPKKDLADLGDQGIRGIRFTFDQTTSGDIYIADIGLSHYTSYTQAIRPGRRRAASHYSMDLTQALLQPTHFLRATTEDVIKAETSAPRRLPRKLVAGRVERIEKTGASNSAVIIEIESFEPFRVRDALPVLRLDSQVMAVGAFPNGGDLRHMVFRVKNEALKTLPDEFKMEMIYLEDPNGEVRDLGTHRKSAFPIY